MKTDKPLTRKNKDSGISGSPDSRPVALILAGYDKADSKTLKRRHQEIIEAYDGDDIYLGENKFLRTLAGRPIIQYVIDAVYNAKKDGRPIYRHIYVYNDRESLMKAIDTDSYSNLTIKQMKDSVGGHWKDFYFNDIDYGQRVDVFFGDTPRITEDDVAWIHGEFGKILARGKDHRGNPVMMVYSVVEFEDMKDNWLRSRVKYIKRGGKKGKLKSYVNFENYQIRVGNSGAIIKHRTLDGLMEHQAINFLYNLRKALTPSSFSKIIYYLWRSKHFDMIRQVKQRNINYIRLYDTSVDILSRLYKIDLDELGGATLHVKRNAARWENDVDGPHDLEIFQKKFGEMESGERLPDAATKA